MALPVIFGALVPIVTRFFVAKFVFSWAKFAAIVVAKFTVFWLIWNNVTSWIFWAFSAIQSLAATWFPSPSDPFVQSTMDVLKYTQAWFPWDYLGFAIQAIITVNLHLQMISLAVKCFKLTMAAVDMIFAGNTA